MRLLSRFQDPTWNRSCQRSRAWPLWLWSARQPLLIISAWARKNFVDHSIADQSLVLRFIEDNWLNGERIQGSLDAYAGTINGMFNFHSDELAGRLFPVSGHGHHSEAGSR